MKNKKLVMLSLGFILLVSVFSFYVSAVETSYCCERIKNNGAFCQNAPLSQCDTTGINPNTGQVYKSSPTSCEATSYCKLGCCNVIDAGECMQNTPQATCGNTTIAGDPSLSWSTNFIPDNPSCGGLAQCQLGCCLMGDQAAFVTQTKCGKLSAMYGLEINFREDITSELECLATATEDTKGACVFEQEFKRTCRMMTQRECNEMKAGEGEGVQNVKFYDETLCSNPELATECTMSEKTTCVEGKDEVYFVDTCGNVANIYDASKVKDLLYWSEVVKEEDVPCNDGSGSAGSQTCGACDYVKGSTCKAFTRKDFQIGAPAPKVGDNMCKDLSCKYDNNGDGKDEQYLHGETWCAHAVPNSGSIKGVVLNDGASVWHLGINPIVVQDNGYVSGYYIEENQWLRSIASSSPQDVAELRQANLPGSRYFRLMCYNGEVIPEPCADYRQEVCIEDQTQSEEVLALTKNLDRESYGSTTYDGFRSAACRVNRWQDCAQQKTPQDCKDIEKRDCKWASLLMDKDGKDENICVPLYPPGLKFWGEDAVNDVENPGSAAGTELGDVANDADAICGVASRTCTITYEINLRDNNRRQLAFGQDGQPGKNLVLSGFGCYDSKWQQRLTEYSMALGDCGIKNNYAGNQGSSKWTSKSDRVSNWN